MINNAEARQIADQANNINKYLEDIEIEIDKACSKGNYKLVYRVINKELGESIIRELRKYGYTGYTSVVERGMSGANVEIFW